MPGRDGRVLARNAIDDFVSYLASREFSAATQRLRRHYLTEYLRHAQQDAQTSRLTVGEFLDSARADAWLADAAAGKTRTRNTLRGPEAAANANSMRVRIDTYNAFAEFLGRPDRIDSPPPVDGLYLTPDDTERLLHDLAKRRPVYANAVTILRTAAVAALVADTGRSVPDLAGLTVSALHLNGTASNGGASVDLPDGPCPISEASVHILSRWLSARAALMAELEGADPGYLWIPTKPGRPRGGQEAVKPGLTPAAVRTLHAAHRTHVSQVLGSPLRPGAFHALPPTGAEDDQETPDGPGERPPS